MKTGALLSGMVSAESFMGPGSFQGREARTVQTRAGKSHGGNLEDLPFSF